MRRFVLTLGALITLAAGVPTAASASAQSRSAAPSPRGCRTPAVPAARTSSTSTPASRCSRGWPARAGSRRRSRSCTRPPRRCSGSGRTRRSRPACSRPARSDRHHGFHGILCLKGGGDPTFGSAGFDQSFYGTGATVGQLADNLIRNTGITSIHGRIVGDDTYFDSLRGTPATGFGPDITDVEGLLSALAYDRGFADLGRNRRAVAPGAVRDPAVRRRAPGARGHDPVEHRRLHRTGAGSTQRSWPPCTRPGWRR